MQTKHVFPSDWSFKDEAFTKIILLEDSDNDLNHSDMGLRSNKKKKPPQTTQKQSKCFCQKCGVLLHPEMCDMNYLTLTQQ